MVSLLLGALIGILVGLAICYYKQIKTVVDNKDKIQAGANFISSGVNLLEQFGVKI